MEIITVLAVTLAGVLAAPIAQLVKQLGGWSDIKAMLAAYVVALGLGGVVAFLTGALSGVVWPPIDPYTLVTQLLALFGVINGIGQIIYREWQKRNPL